MYWHNSFLLQGCSNSIIQYDQCKQCKQYKQFIARCYLYLWWYFFILFSSLGPSLLCEWWSLRRSRRRRRGSFQDAGRGDENWNWSSQGGGRIKVDKAHAPHTVIKSKARVKTSKQGCLSGMKWHIAGKEEVRQRRKEDVSDTPTVTIEHRL